MSYTLEKDFHLLLLFPLGPGISEFAKKLGEIDIYLEACMERARTVVPKSQHAETPVYLGATAGMRLLRYRGGLWGPRAAGD